MTYALSGHWLGSVQRIARTLCGLICLENPTDLALIASELAAFKPHASPAISCGFRALRQPRHKPSTNHFDRIKINNKPIPK
jgi:hypothetical protein